MNLSNPVTKAVAREVMKGKFPNLIPVEDNALVTAAKNARIELKAAFPGVKFSVKTERYSGGDSMRVYWTDGPTTKEVDAIVKKYSAGSFDGMVDLYTYEPDAFTTTFGDAKFVFSERAYSDEFVAKAIAAAIAKYGGEPISVEDYRRGAAWNWRNSAGPNAVDMGRGLQILMSNTSAAMMEASEPYDGYY